MALDIKARYGSRANDPSVDYPTGSIKNKSAPDATDGTPLEKDWGNDWLGARDAILSAASIVADGNVEKVGASQVLAAIQKIALTIANSVTPVVAAIVGSFSNLKLSANGTSAQVSITANELVVESAANTYLTLRNINISPSLAAAGANGLDAGVSAINTWYSAWVIWNSTTIAGLFSLSATAPIMPSGYTHKARVGWVRSDSTANKFPLAFKQEGADVQFAVASATNVLNLPVVASGVAGNVSTPTWTPISLSSFIAPTAARVRGSLYQSVISANAAAILAPNGNYGAIGSATNPPPLVTNGSGAATMSVPFDFLVESNSIYWASNNASILVSIIGWRDKL